MKVLVTGAKGFVGKNLCAQLNNIKEGKARNYPVTIDRVFEYDVDSTPDELESYAREADFVFNLAGVNRPENPDDFMKGNFGFLTQLLEALERNGNKCPVMLSSSIQASMTGRYAGHPYGQSKRDAEDYLFKYADRTGAKALVYRFPNLFGKWCRPNYNSAVATFANNIANDLPIQVNDPNVELELLYIDDLVEEMIAALSGNEHRADYDDTTPKPSPEGRYGYVPTTHKVKLGEIVEMLERFKEMPRTLGVPDLTPGGFEKKLYSTYLSYLPAEKMAYDLKMNTDDRGSFTEIIRTANAGQMSVNISKPGITKGQHWHHTKNEKFVVVKGHGLIQLRKEGTDEILNFEVSGDKIQVVEMIPGYTHNIINLSDTEDLVTLMWCNEPFDPQHPDTFFDPV